MNMDYVQTLKVGDKVRRLLAGTVPMELTVIKVDDDFIYCGTPDVPSTMSDPEAAWKFNRTFGYEVDEELGWGVPQDGSILTGSYLVQEDAP